MTGLARDASACSAAMRTSGRPLISASSLFGPPMRVERPAASTRAAMRRPAFGRRLGARLRPRDDLHQQPADAHAGDVARAAPAARRAGASAPSRSRSPSGERAQPGAPSTGRPSALATSSRLPGSTGMPKCSMRAADRLDRRRDHVAPVGDRRGAEHDHQLGAARRAPRRAPRRARPVSCGTRRSATIVAPAGASRSCVTLRVFSITLSARPGSSVEIDADLADAVRRDAHDRRCAARAAASARVARVAPRPRTG